MDAVATDTLVQAVRATKRFFGLFSGTALFGIPLDWPVRFAAMTVLCFVLRFQVRRRIAAAICAAILLGSELLEVFASRVPHRYYWPDLGDAADVAFGLAGILAGDWAWRRYLSSRSIGQQS